MEFRDRSHQILVAVVSLYIREGTPVGSRTLTEHSEFGLSSATIRAIMAELEEMGFLSHPHTSAGRIPTEKGYRYYVDELISDHLDAWDAEVRIEESQLTAKRDDLKELLQETSDMLSLMSHYTGVVMAPDISHHLLKRLEFVKLRPGHFLVILITQDGLLYNRLIEMDEDVAQSDLDRIAHSLNQQFTGLNLQEVRRRLLHEMEEEKNVYDRIIQKVIELGQKAVRVEPECELFLGGTSNILDLPEFADHESIKALLTAFEEKAVIVKLLNKCLDTEGVNVFIGSENENRHMGKCSLVSAKYRHGQTVGTLGIIGPTRMDYDRVIPLVDDAAKTLTRVLNFE